ncbi:MULTISPECIES: SRPBCC family protein [unclassified Blastococcus]
MTSTENRDTGGGGGLLSTLRNNPAVHQLGEAAKDYARARGADAVKKVGGKLTGVTGSLTDKAEGGGFKSAAVSKAVEKVAQGESPVKAAFSGVGAGIKEKVKSAFGKSGGGGNKKFVTIIEDITIGVPVDVAYDQWTQFQEFASFTKGVESVDQADEVTSNWKVKVAKSRRSWQAKVTEQIPDRRIVWTTEGAKATTKGVVTFHPLADDLTQVLLVMEYYPKGLFEKTGNIWRAQGRRARLDLKHFRRFVMFRNEATGSWRGEIRDGEVVRGPDEGEEERRSYASEGSEELTGQTQDTGDEDAGDEYAEDEDYDESAEDEDEGYDEDEDEDEDYDEEDEEEDEDEEADGDTGYEDEVAATEEEPEEEPAPPARRRRREPVGAR